MQSKIQNSLKASIEIKEKSLNDRDLLTALEDAIKEIIKVYQRGGKVLFCGNGGSAADAQHMAAELSGRFYFDRPPLYAEALHVNSSFVTAVANDYGYEYVFSRMLEAAGKSGDVLVVLSTSGNSPGIIKAIEVARKNDILVIGFTGQTGGKMAALCDILLKVPSNDTPRIQEVHITLGHILCEQVESLMFPR